MTEPKSTHPERRDVPSVTTNESKATDLLSKETFQNPQEFLRILRLDASPIASLHAVPILDGNVQNRDLLAQTKTISNGAGALSSLGLGAAETTGSGLAKGHQSAPRDTDKLPKRDSSPPETGISKGTKAFSVQDLGAAETAGSELAKRLQSAPRDTEKLHKGDSASPETGISKGAKASNTHGLGAAGTAGSELAKRLQADGSNDRGVIDFLNPIGSIAVDLIIAAGKRAVGADSSVTKRKKD